MFIFYIFILPLLHSDQFGLRFRKFYDFATRATIECYLCSSKFIGTTLCV